MPTIVYLSPEALTYPPAMARLSTLVAAEDVVLVCVQWGRGSGIVPALRAVLGRHEVVALLVDDDDIQRHERRLIEELLEEGKIPLIMTLEDRAISLADLAWLHPDDSVVLAAAPAVPARASTTRPVEDRPRLTRREAEIAEMVARGLTDRQIAARLVVSVRAVERHVENILTKFDFGTRGQIAAWRVRRRRHSG